MEFFSSGFRQTKPTGYEIPRLHSCLSQSHQVSIKVTLVLGWVRRGEVVTGFGALGFSFSFFFSVIESNCTATRKGGVVNSK